MIGHVLANAPRVAAIILWALMAFLRGGTVSGGLRVGWRIDE